MDCIEFADKVVVGLQHLMSDLPDGFYGSFRFTQTGKNYTHPITLGFLARFLMTIPEVKQVGIDFRLNLGKKVKFQPDLAALDARLDPVAFIDYESPNSSDSRLPEKDIDAYLAWQEKSGQSVPYVIVTTLPNQAAPDWELRYAAPGYYNEHFHGKEDVIRQNPYRFWYDGHFQKEFKKREMKNIALVNIDGRAVNRVHPKS